MNKEQLIKKIETVVKKNSKKGVLTTTKFVGTYNYKSGYDTYIAVSYDERGDIVVYSYYQNDRCEHIDTYTQAISKLPEDELEAVFKNLNTDDDDINHYINWENLEEKNTEILTALGLFKPVRKETKFIDIDYIPELENKKDGYWIDKDDNVGILRFKGKSPSGDDVYEVEGKGIIDKPYNLGEVGIFHHTDRYHKAKGAFKVVTRESMTDYDFIYVPTKEQLLKIAKKERNIKQYFFVDENLNTWKRATFEDPTKNLKEGVKVFTDKNEAVEYFNALTEQNKAKFTDLLDKLTKCKNEVVELVMTNGMVKANKCSIECKDAVMGKRYYQCSMWGKINSKTPFTVIERDKNTGLLTLDNGCVLPPDWHVMEEENAVKVIEAEKHKSILEYVKELENKENLAKNVLNALEKWIPFSTDGSIPNWYYEDSMKLIKDKSNKLRPFKKLAK